MLPFCLAGFKAGLHNQTINDVCTNLTGIVQNACREGEVAGESLLANSSYPYHFGYHVGILDKKINTFNLDFGLCDRFHSSNTYIFTPWDECASGYNDGNKYGHIDANAISIFHKTAPCVKGFKAGLASKNSYYVCGDDKNRYSIICNDAYDDAQNTLPWTYYKTHMYGYNYGKLGAEGKASGDRAGDCEIDPQRS